MTPDLTISHVLKDTNAQFILTLEKFHAKTRRLAGTKTTIVAVDSVDENMISSMIVRPKIQLDTKDGVYIIYTSGTYNRYENPEMLTKIREISEGYQTICI